MPYQALLAHLRRQEARECVLGERALDPRIKAIHFALAERYGTLSIEIKREKGPAE